MKRCLLLVGVLLLSSLSLSEPAQAADYKTEIINSFETGTSESTVYGNWSESTQEVGAGDAYILQNNTEIYHGSYSCRLHVYSPVAPTSFARATMTFTSNSSLGHFMFDSVTVMWKLTHSSGDVYMHSEFCQWNSSALLDIRTDYLTYGGWSALVMTPVWDSDATYFTWEIEVFTDVGEGDLFLDMFSFNAGIVDVRVRYWNLYTGLGYYTEKLLARYYTLEEGWVDIWQNEFQAYKGDEVLVQVTDIFQRNIWTGTVSVNSDPEYLDILVPIVTVYIPKPDWYNDSVPMEWRITCLPWGPDGPPGMELPTTGFEFEILAGWYSISWLENHYVKAGNQTVYIDGNITAKRSFMLTNITIPINPDYQVEVKGGNKLFDLSKWGDLINVMAALYDDNRVKAAGLALLFLSIFIYMHNANRLAQRKLREGSR